MFVFVCCRSTRPYSKMSVDRPVETAVVLSRTTSASMAAPARRHDADVSRINRQFPEFTSTFSPSSHALYQVWNNTVDMGEQGGTKLKQKSVWWINYCHVIDDFSMAVTSEKYAGAVGWLVASSQLTVACVDSGRTLYVISISPCVIRLQARMLFRVRCDLLSGC